MQCSHDLSSLKIAKTRSIAIMLSVILLYHSHIGKVIAVIYCNEDTEDMLSNLKFKCKTLDSFNHMSWNGFYPGLMDGNN